MEHRDRSSGWKHAKLSGHTNEERVKNLLTDDPEYAEDLMRRMGRDNLRIMSASIGGLHETNVPGVLGKKTKSKTDLKITCSNGETIKVSIKKSFGGQVYFVRANLFIEVFEKQFKTIVPNDVQRAIKLFWAQADDALDIIEQYSDKSDAKSHNLQVRHKSLNATTLRNFDEHLHKTMLKWFKDNTYELTKLSFTMGAVEDKDEWSDYVWYINLIEEDNVDVDSIYCIEDICNAAVNVAEKETYYGDSNGGTTIQLPFGFVQWHQAQMQFHHNYEKVCKLLGCL